MKKLLSGCLVTGIVALVALTIGAVVLYRSAGPVWDSARAYWSRLSDFGAIDQKISNKAPYTPVASGELTEAQVQRFARVQESVRGALGQRMRQIDEKYRALTAGDAAQTPSLTQFAGALGELSTIFVDARQFQVNALNANGFSRAEYSWVRKQVFEAAGIEALSAVDLAQVEQAIKNRTGIDAIRMPEVPESSVPARNRALVKPYLGEVDEWIPLAFFGM